MNLHATHVAYVNDGAVTLEERPLRDSDWRDDAAAAGGDAEEDEEEDEQGGAGRSDSGSRSVDPKALAEQRQLAFKRRSALPKLEAKIEDAEAQVRKGGEEGGHSQIVWL
jgi:hypothetical protein